MTNLQLISLICGGLATVCGLAAVVDRYKITPPVPPPWELEPNLQHEPDLRHSIEAMLLWSIRHRRAAVLFAAAVKLALISVLILVVFPD
jgi:hypothetical protein